MGMKLKNPMNLQGKLRDFASNRKRVGPSLRASLTWWKSLPVAGAKFSLVKVGLIWVSSFLLRLIALFTILGNTYLPPWAKLAIHVEFMKLELEIDHCQRPCRT